MAERNVYQFQFMKKGESILLEGAAHGGKESAAARNYFSRRKMEYKLKKVDGGIMVTLLSEGQPSTERGKRRVRRQQLFSGNRVASPIVHMSTPRLSENLWLTCW